MNKSELIAVLAERKGLSVKKAEEIINTIFGSIVDALKADDRITLRGFGSLAVKEYKPYRGRNPKSGVAVDVKPKKRPVFRTGKYLKEIVSHSVRQNQPIPSE